MVAQYRIFVEEGGLPLHEAPLWLVDVAQEVRRYRSKMRARQEEDKRAREKSREMIDAAFPEHSRPSL